MESYLKMRIIDIFVDWDLELDKSLIVLITNPKELLGKDNLDKVNFV
jgi:hypothetical protein